MSVATKIKQAWLEEKIRKNKEDYDELQNRLAALKEEFHQLNSALAETKESK